MQPSFWVPRILHASLLALTLHATGCARDADGRAAGDGLPADRVVARVNGAPVYASQVERALAAERARRRAAGGTTLDEARLRAESLELVIDGELCVQAARAAGIVVPAAAIDARLAAARSQFVDDAAWTAHLEQAGLSEQVLRDEAARRLLLRSYADGVAENLNLDADRARELYERDRDQFTVPEQVRVEQVLVRVEPAADAATRAAGLERARAARRRAQAGEAFETLAAEYSDLPRADIGPIPRGRMLPAYDAAVFDRPVGALSDVFETEYGFHVVRVLEHFPERRRPYAEVETSLLMVLAREQQDLALRAQIEALRAKAEIVYAD